MTFANFGGVLGYVHRLMSRHCSSHCPISLAGKIRPTVIDQSNATRSNYRFASARITRLGEGIYI